MKNYLIVLLVGSYLFFLHGDGLILAYDDQTVHPKINRYAALSSVSGSGVSKTDKFIRGQLGFALGLEETIVMGKSIVGWIEEGGKVEDSGVNWLHHFHDPLKPWWQAGLSDSILGGSSVCWAQGDTTDERTWLSPPFLTEPTSNDFDWTQVRR